MKKQPKEMYLLSLIEMCQRFAFWGIGNLLVLYVVSIYQFSDQQATHLYGMFTAIAFILPFFGGYIADRTSHQKSVVIGSLSTAFGCLLLATGNLVLLYLGLLFAATGASVFTPSIYTLLSRLYQTIPHLREGGFSIYYSAVNLGVFFATFILGALGHVNLWSVAFIVAACIQLLGLFIFLKVMKLPSFIQMHQPDALDEQAVTALTAVQKGRIVVICILSLISILFWMCYVQGWSSMTLFTLNYTDKVIQGFNVPTSWFLSLETFYLVLLAFPLASLYKWLEKHRKDPSASMKTALSLISMGLCFLLMRQACLQIPPEASCASVSPGYLTTAFAFMALAEMLIAPIGLSLVTKLSPPHYTAQLVGIWYLCVGIASYLGGIMAGWMSSMKELSSFFEIFIYLAWIPAVILLMVAKKLTQLSHLEEIKRL
ncbi:MAG: peptide MFS transporter [Candidatus Rhabdochlamydia sp.]